MINEKITVMSLPYAGTGNKKVRIYVPEHESNENLPVIYMTDGQNLFEYIENSGQFGCWYTREAIKAEAEKSGKKAVIVGIHNDESPFDRANDLTPSTIGRYIIPPGFDEKMRALIDLRGEVFARFVIETVMPEVEEQFPVRTGKENTAFCGSSAGGLEALFTVLTYPDKFCAAGVFSPAPLRVIYAPEDAEKWLINSVKDKRELPLLYLYSGAAEPIEQDICKDTELTYELLSRYYTDGKLKKVIKPEEKHHESAWAEQFRDFLHIFLNAEI